MEAFRKPPSHTYTQADLPAVPFTKEWEDLEQGIWGFF